MPRSIPHKTSVLHRMDENGIIRSTAYTNKELVQTFSIAQRDRLVAGKPVAGTFRGRPAVFVSATAMANNLLCK